MLNIEGKTAKKRCLVIPIQDNPGIFVGERGVYLNATAIEQEEPKFEDTHFIKPDIPKEMREKMSEEERRQVPIIGSLKKAVYQRTEVAASGTITRDALEESADALPF